MTDDLDMVIVIADAMAGLGWEDLKFRYGISETQARLIVAVHGGAHGRGISSRQDVGARGADEPRRAGARAPAGGVEDVPTLRTGRDGPCKGRDEIQAGPIILPDRLRGAGDRS